MYIKLVSILIFLNAFIGCSAKVKLYTWGIEIKHIILAHFHGKQKYL